MKERDWYLKRWVSTQVGMVQCLWKIMTKFSEACCGKGEVLGSRVDIREGEGVVGRGLAV